MDDWRSYDGIAEAYERIHAPRMAQPARDLVAMARPSAGGRVLDVGTGTGVAVSEATKAVGPGGLAVGVDVSLGMLEEASRARPGVRLAAASAIDLPFRDGTFDVVTASFVVSHFTKYQTALFDMIRVLKPGGRLGMSSWADNNTDDLQKTWFGLVEAAVGQLLLRDIHAQAVPWGERFADRAALEEALMDAGLRQIRTERREYRFTYTLDEYVEGLGTWSTGRFLRSMLGPAGWEAFRSRAHEVFQERFSDPVNDFRDVWLALGQKP
ncbi:MAG TPA: class I SAM-dependent methyltransferase [Actinomycetota bacterium]|nr:class I SAM-dependent methyltransferase [Actinomycetota bacterium]